MEINIDLDDGRLHEIPWDPPLTVAAGDVIGWAADFRRMGVYRDDQLVQVYELRDGAMRPVAEGGAS